MNTKKNKIATFGILGLLLIGIVAAGAYAMPGFIGSKGQYGMNEDVKVALDSGDYEGFMAATDAAYQNHRNNFDEEQFNEMTLRHQERMADREQRQSEQQAIMDEICSTGNIPENLGTVRSEYLEENFDAVCEIHDAKVNGATQEEIQELASELGIEQPQGKFGQGMNNQGLGKNRLNHEGQNKGNCLN